MSYSKEFAKHITNFEWAIIDELKYKRGWHFLKAQDWVHDNLCTYDNNRKDLAPVHRHFLDVEKIVDYIDCKEN